MRLLDFGTTMEGTVPMYIILALVSVLLVAVAASGDALFEDSHVVKMEKGQYGPRGMPGDVVALKNGTLLLCYTQTGIRARSSEDQGKTWSDEFTLVANPGPSSERGYYCHPSFLRLANGDILLSYIYANGSLPYYGHNYYKRTRDEGKTWSEQFVMTPKTGYVIMHNDKLRLLSTGRILAPAEYKKRWPDSRDHSGYCCTVFYSDDNGYSWHEAANDVDFEPHEAQEPHVVEMKNGTVLMMFRTYSGWMGQAFSPDQGVSWSQPEAREDLSLPRSGAVSVDRIPTTGDLLLIRITGTCDGKRRAPLTSMISKDDGVTWENPRNIGPDPEDDYGYQSVTLLDDVAIISYHARDGLHVARIGYDWFYGSD